MDCKYDDLYVSLRRTIQTVFFSFEYLNFGAQVAAVDRPQGNKIYNLGNGSPVTLRNFISEIEKVCGWKTYTFHFRVRDTC